MCMRTKTVMTIGQIFFFIYTSNSSSSHGEEHYFFHFGVLFFSFCSIGNILFILRQLIFCHFSVFCVFNVSPTLFLWVPPTIRSAATFFWIYFVFFSSLFVFCGHHAPLFCGATSINLVPNGYRKRVKVL